MADIPRSSFIPKEAPGMVPARVKRKKAFHVFDFLATALLLGSLALAIGSYFLKVSAENKFQDTTEKLQAQKELFKSESIVEVREFDRRLRGAEYLLNNHVSPLKIFNALELQAKEKVQFTSLSFEHDPSLDILLTVAGGTEEFRTLALQALQFRDDPLLKDVIFTQIGTSDVVVGDQKKDAETVVDKNHKINFTFVGALSPDSILYKGSLAQPANDQSITIESQVPPVYTQEIMQDTQAGVTNDTPESGVVTNP